jgi:cell division protein FtsL
MTKKRKSKKSKSKGILASLILYVLLPSVIVIFGILFLRSEIKILYKEIYQKEKEVEILQNQLEARLVEVQKLSAEERIIEIAKQKFGMVRIFSPVENIFVSELKIKQIQKIVDSKYD